MKIERGQWETLIQDVMSHLEAGGSQLELDYFWNLSSSQTRIKLFASFTASVKYTEQYYFPP